VIHAVTLASPNPSLKTATALRSSDPKRTSGYADCNRRASLWLINRRNFMAFASATADTSSLSTYVSDGGEVQSWLPE
jgi:hypothetical protein